MSYQDFNATKAGHQLNQPKPPREALRDAYPFHRYLSLEVRIEAALLAARFGKRVAA